jgi:uncharacterized protein
MRMTMDPQGMGTDGPPRVVLDTNVVLDWLWFADPATRRLERAVSQQHVEWVVCAGTTVELVDVLARPQFIDISGQRRKSVLASIERWGRHCSCPERRHPLVCRDPDDQIFLDLALGCGARWLLTRDRALLELAPRAASWRCHIVEPGNWTLETSA